MKPCGVQGCQLIRFPYLQAAHPPANRARSASRHSRHKQEQSNNRSVISALSYLTILQQNEGKGGEKQERQSKGETEKTVLTQASNGPLAGPNKSSDIWSCVFHVWCRLKQQLRAPSVWHFILSLRPTDGKLQTWKWNWWIVLFWLYTVRGWIWGLIFYSGLDVCQVYG